MTDSYSNYDRIKSVIESDSLEIDDVLEILNSDKENQPANWIEVGLPKLVDKMIKNYHQYGGLNHLEGKELPSQESVIGILEDLLTVIFPGYVGKNEIKNSNINYFLGNILHSIYFRLAIELEKSLKYICKKVKKCPEDICRKLAEIVAKELLESIPNMRILLRGDMQAAFDGDPAAKSIEEVILSYPYVLAIATYRISHELYVRRIPIVPRIMSEYAHSKTGIDIHPGAVIGKNFFIDHGTGVVIGETAEIGDDVKIYQGVTLGALSFPKDKRGNIIRGRKRHPTIGHNVVIYSGATLLGEKTIIGDNAIIGGNVWLTSRIPPGTKVTIVLPELSYKNVSKPKNQLSNKPEE